MRPQIDNSFVSLCIQLVYLTMKYEGNVEFLWIDVPILLAEDDDLWAIVLKEELLLHIARVRDKKVAFGIKFNKTWDADIREKVLTDIKGLNVLFTNGTFNSIK